MPTSTAPDARTFSLSKIVGCLKNVIEWVENLEDDLAYYASASKERPADEVKFLAKNLDRFEDHMTNLERNFRELNHELKAIKFFDSKQVADLANALDVDVKMASEKLGIMRSAQYFVSEEVQNAFDDVLREIKLSAKSMGSMIVNLARQKRY